jgi:hypothetical protein
MVQCRIHIPDVPQDQSIDYQTQGAELIFLTLAMPLPEVSTLAMKALAKEPMTALTTVNCVRISRR